VYENCTVGEVSTAHFSTNGAILWWKQKIPRVKILRRKIQILREGHDCYQGCSYSISGTERVHFASGIRTWESSRKKMTKKMAKKGETTHRRAGRRHLALSYVLHVHAMRTRCVGTVWIPRKDSSCVIK
jgi:hypothetical protein